MSSRGNCAALVALATVTFAFAQVNPFYSNFDSDPVGDNAPAGFTEFGGGVTGPTGGINVVTNGFGNQYNFEASMAVSLSGTSGDGYGMGLRRQSFVRQGTPVGSFRTSADFTFSTVFINSNTPAGSGTMAGLTAFIDPVTAYGYYLSFVFDPVSYDTFAGANSTMQAGSLRLLRYSSEGSVEVVSSSGLTPVVGQTYHIVLDVLSNSGGVALRGSISNDAEDMVELEFGTFYPPMTGNGFGMYQQSQVFTTVQPGAGYSAGSANSVARFDNYRIEAVPEPASLVGLGLVGLGAFRKRKALAKTSAA